MNQPATATHEPISRPRIEAANRSGHHRNRSKDERVAELQRLYRSVLERFPDDNYIKAHSQINSIRRQVDVFQLYNPYLPEEGVVLDWGV